ncbi:MAG TPA: hypothetical protein VM346_05895 [Sphingomicrobium sp.]|nr:hypothetical protein [Sphingomicrobium sp.]
MLAFFAAVALSLFVTLLLALGAIVGVGQSFIRERPRYCEAFAFI